MPPATSAEIARLEAEALHHRNRLALYRARVLTGSPTASLQRLRELERTSAAADARAAHAATSA